MIFVIGSLFTLLPISGSVDILAHFFGSLELGEWPGLAE